MIDLKVLAGVVFQVIDTAEARLPIPVISATVVEKIEAGVVTGLAAFAKLDEADRDTLVRAVVLASDAYDIRAGRTGGAGRKEWYKGGASAAEPSGAAAKIAKRLRDGHGLDKGDALRVANAYLDALAEGDVGAMDDASMVKRFK